MSDLSLKYALCIESIFPSQMDFAERIRHTIETGYGAVEVWRVSDEKKKVLLNAKARGVSTAMMIGASGFAISDKAYRQQLEALKRKLDVARELDCPNICLFIGNRDPALIHDQGRTAVVEFLEQAAGVLAGSGVTGIVESLSPENHPKAFAYSMRDVISWIREINRPEIRLQFDIYHTAMTDPHVEKLVRDNIHYTAYFQAADAPSHAQPGTGVLNFAKMLGDIKAAGFDGYFCWEYKPRGDALESIRVTRQHQI